MSARVVALACRTSDRTEAGARGAQMLAERVAADAEVAARTVGSPGAPRAGNWADDVRDARGCLLEAGGQAADAWAEGDRPLLFASECSIALTTLAAAVAHRPAARIVWLDAHGDFNTPATTPSGYLGGMCLAGACGRWDAGLGAAPIDAGRVVTCGVRDVDAGERVELERAGVVRADPATLASLVRGERVFVHLDVDVLDPRVMPAQFPAPLGLSLEGLGRLLAELAGAADVMGAEVTAFEPPPGPPGDRLADQLAAILVPLT